jgi:hypothetical protein
MSASLGASAHLPILETTLNVKAHAIPESQRRPVDKTAKILFPHGPNFPAAAENETADG